MFLYYSCRLDIMWVIIYTSSIITSNFCKSPINNSISVIHSYSLLVTSSNSHFSNFFHILVLDAPFIGLNLLFNFPHARKYHPLVNSLVTNYSTIWKHTVSSCSKIRSLYALLFICLSIASSLVFYDSFSSGVSQFPLVWYHIQVIPPLLRTSLATYSICTFIH